MKLSPWLATLLIAATTAALHAASDYDEFKVKREAVFAFAQKPTVKRAGDRVTIEFETKGFCNATVAIEEGTVPLGGGQLRGKRDDTPPWEHRPVDSE